MLSMGNSEVYRPWSTPRYNRDACERLQRGHANQTAERRRSRDCDAYSRRGPWL
jgi:hypothetical protein